MKQNLVAVAYVLSCECNESSFSDIKKIIYIFIIHDILRLERKKISVKNVSVV